VIAFTFVKPAELADASVPNPTNVNESTFEADTLVVQVASEPPD